MDLKVLIVSLFCLGINVIYCTNPIEDSVWLEAAADKYNPALVKSLIRKRIDHKIGQIELVKSSVGINKKQVELCDNTIKSLKSVKTGLQFMDQTESIYGGESSDQILKGYISQFAKLTETFNKELDSLRIPDLTKDTPSAIIDLLATSCNSCQNKALNSINIYRTDIESKSSTAENDLLRTYGNAAKRQLSSLYDVIKVGNSDLKAEMYHLKEILFSFYRQYEILIAQ
ncbi:uncharacterized protein LOC128396483 [Panonychus citri]|uniref:uncharacterized protein LOC128396483 n=1 Tax=Panonychus citri TaxID=50023 RepID=UPI00230807AE|nr:uncharacterized protein LOC128396483 [Panonychus citri]